MDRCRLILVSLFLTLAFFITTPMGQNIPSNPSTVEHILLQNQCFCPCKPMERKEYYIPIRRTNDWFGAVSFCREIGMEIAEVLNEADAEALAGVLAEEDSYENDEFFWIGANDLGTQGILRWALTGRLVTYASWAEGEPNNAQGESESEPAEHCAAIGKDSLKWNDFRCTHKKKFICQKFQDD
ncbi:C-type lectin 37Db-like [Anopheles nili]|uniref:C-type lectin 37Db-like n=1 Tax=Anopheles nili TaxID=185578 RepID=UPI00237C231C|nr:C-type lectin 37Db-like [Anopheles nili]